MIQFTLYNISFSLSMPEKQHNPSIAYQNSPIFHPCNYIYIYCMCFLCLFCFLFLDPIYTHTKKNLSLFLSFSLSLSLFIFLLFTHRTYTLFTRLKLLQSPLPQAFCIRVYGPILLQYRPPLLYISLFACFFCLEPFCF